MAPFLLPPRMSLLKVRDVFFNISLNLLASPMTHVCFVQPQ